MAPHAPHRRTLAWILILFAFLCVTVGEYHCVEESVCQDDCLACAPAVLRLPAITAMLAPRAGRAAPPPESAPVSALRTVTTPPPRG